MVQADCDVEPCTNRQLPVWRWLQAAKEPGHIAKKTITKFKKEKQSANESTNGTRNTGTKEHGEDRQRKESTLE